MFASLKLFSVIGVALADVNGVGKSFSGTGGANIEGLRPFIVGSVVLFDAAVDVLTLMVSFGELERESTRV
jgi:hypothetical protein